MRRKYDTGTGHKIEKRTLTCHCVPQSSGSGHAPNHVPIIAPAPPGDGIVKTVWCHSWKVPQPMMRTPCKCCITIVELGIFHSEKFTIAGCCYAELIFAIRFEQQKYAAPAHSAATSDCRSRSCLWDMEYRFGVMTYYFSPALLKSV